jgi:hypothetical protein
MIKQGKGKKICVFTFLFAFVCFFSFFCPLASSQPRQYVVQKGDTLSSICEKYYADPTLWPKLLQMNPSITDPKALKVGQVITLFEKETTKKEESPAKKPIQEVAYTKTVLKGIALGDRLDLDSVGYFSLVDVEPLGRIQSEMASKMVISTGDRVFVDFGSAPDINPGDVFSMAHVSDLVRHPITNRPLGYVVSMRGTLTVTEHVKDGLYLAKVEKAFTEVFPDDIVLPRQSIGTCLQPMPADPKLYGNIVAVDDNRTVIGKYTIVYLDSGFKDGVQTGSTFDVVRLHRKPMLEFDRYPLSDIAKDAVHELGKQEYLEDFMREIVEGKTIYEYSVGKLIVIDAKPDTAIGVILASKEELAPGAFIKGMPWVEPPAFLTSLPACVAK